MVSKTSKSNLQPTDRLLLWYNARPHFVAAVMPAGLNENSGVDDNDRSTLIGLDNVAHTTPQVWPHDCVESLQLLQEFEL